VAQIDEALKKVRELPLDTTAPAWEIMQGVLANGPDFTITDGRTDRPVRAIDFICCRSNYPTYKIPGGLVQEVAGMPYFSRGNDRLEGDRDLNGILNVLGQVGVSENLRLITSKGHKVRLRDVINHAQLTADVTAWRATGQELGDTLEAFAHYVPVGETWTNLKGEPVSLERIVGVAVQRPLGEFGKCAGTHELAGLVAALDAYRAAHPQEDPTGVWGQAARQLNKARSRALKYQSETGAFTDTWYNRKRAPGNAEERVHATGHVLAWLISYSTPEELRQEWIREAVVLLAETLVEHFDEVKGNTEAVTHASHALAAYRKKVGL
jgi:hypothetical protein